MTPATSSAPPPPGKGDVFDPDAGPSLLSRLLPVGAIALVALGGCPSANQVHYFLPASTDTDKICKVRGGGLLAAASGGPWNINKGHARARRPFPHRWAALCNLQL